MTETGGTATATGKRRRWPWILAALLAAFAIFFFVFAPGIAERRMNRIDGKPLPEVSAAAKALHAKLFIVDLHSDSFLWDRDLAERATQGHMDLPRLQDGNVALQLFSATTQTPWGLNYDSNPGGSDQIWLLALAQRWPMATWNSRLERALHMAARMHGLADESDGALIPVGDAGQLAALLGDRLGGGRKVGAMMTIEGLHALDGDAKNLDTLYDAGYRMASLTHFFDNRLAGSMHGEKKGGLTRMGRMVVARMEEKGMVVDIAHLSHTGVAELLAMARRPVVSSHGGVQATCKVNRNLTDEEIRGVAKTGGLIGIGYWDAAICDTSPKAIAAAMKHVRDLVGIDHVALGSDYDGATTVRFDTAHLAQVTQALMEAGFTEQEIRAAMGGNALRLLAEGLVPMAPPAALPANVPAGLTITPAPKGATMSAEPAAK